MGVQLLGRENMRKDNDQLNLIKTRLLKAIKSNNFKDIRTNNRATS